MYRTWLMLPLPTPWLKHGQTSRKLYVSIITFTIPWLIVCFCCHSDRKLNQSQAQELRRGYEACQGHQVYGNSSSVQEDCNSGKLLVHQSLRWTSSSLLYQRKVYKEDSGMLFWDKVDTRLVKIHSLAKGDASLITWWVFPGIPAAQC